MRGGEREIDVLSVLRQLADRNARLVTLSESGGRYTAGSRTRPC